MFMRKVLHGKSSNQGTEVMNSATDDIRKKGMHSSFISIIEKDQTRHLNAAKDCAVFEFFLSSTTHEKNSEVLSDIGLQVRIHSVRLQRSTKAVVEFLAKLIPWFHTMSIEIRRPVTAGSGKVRNFLAPMLLFYAVQLESMLRTF